MAVASTSKFGVFRPATRIVLHGNSRPVVDGVGEAGMASLSSEDDTALSGLFGYGRNSCQTAQGGVIASPQSIPGFCEQRGEDGPSHSRQGCEDLRVMLLLLPRLGFLGRNEASREGLDPAVSVFDLPIEQSQARNKRSDMGARGFDSSGGDLDRRLTQVLEDSDSVEASDAMPLEQFDYRRLAQTACFLWCRCGFPEFEQPLGSKVIFKFEQGREVTPELFSQAIGEAVAFDAEVFGDARPLAQFDDDRVDEREQAKATRISAQGGSHDLGVAAVILGAGHREPITEAVHLFRVDRVNIETALDQRLDHRAVRDFDRDIDLAGLGGSARRYQPSCHLGEAFAAVLEKFFTDFPPGVIS